MDVSRISERKKLYLKGTQFANINKVLLKYRILQGSVTRVANKDLESRYEVHKLIYQNYLCRSSNGMTYLLTKGVLHYPCL